MTCTLPEVEVQCGGTVVLSPREMELFVLEDPLAVAAPKGS